MTDDRENSARIDVNARLAIYNDFFCCGDTSTLSLSLRRKSKILEIVARVGGSVDPDSRANLATVDAKEINYDLI